MKGMILSGRVSLVSLGLWVFETIHLWGFSRLDIWGHGLLFHDNVKTMVWLMSSHHPGLRLMLTRRRC